MISIEGNDKEVHVTIPRTDLTPEQLDAVLRPLRFAGLVANSQMAESDAIQMAEKSKSDWWKKNEHLFETSND